MGSKTEAPNDVEQFCCYGAIMFGESRCTCWEPVYDAEQLPPLAGKVQTLSTCCDDCAYRNGSPEKLKGEDDHLFDIAAGEASKFYCHKGMRQVIFWKHPDGREKPGGDYHPITKNGAWISWALHRDEEFDREADSCTAGIHGGRDKRGFSCRCLPIG
jgi:hypothetical protein